ncbi:autophagy 3 [Actinidia rufa]|uniref:Autophagy 3 n=1 Tax=Actinidia rufa TaxID=165716 RepID=A0A7J0GX90_9ERIC|nr:autophagy 3 [Actinidia rufa]
MVLSQKLHEAFKGTVERMTNPRTVSAFKEKGVLSISEFILAGDNLVSKCPTWSWESGEPSKRKSYLPSEKQFLITRNGVQIGSCSVSLPSVWHGMGTGWARPDCLGLWPTSSRTRTGHPPQSPVRISKLDPFHPEALTASPAPSDPFGGPSPDHVTSPFQFLVYVELHQLKKNMKLLVVKFFLIMMIMMVGLQLMGKPKGNNCDEEENLPSMETLEISKNNTIQSISSYFGGEEEEDIPDMAEYEEPDNLIETDPATLQSTYLVAHEPDDDNILRTRTYDVSIMYDKYYQTPRVWLTGYDESRMLLQPELVLEDVSQDHARKTVTIEDHPHLPGKHASVHPCRHGAVMKKIIDVLMSRGVEPEVDKYLFLFLKFVASVIPTIEYDYTMDFDLGSSSI